jgi:hypothetical protein
MESEQSCICVKRVSILTTVVSTIFLLYFGFVPKVWYALLLFDYVTIFGLYTTKMMCTTLKMNETLFIRRCCKMYFMCKE